MKHWQETSRVVDGICRLGGLGRTAALAVLTRVEGSAYRRPGAKLLIEPDGAMLGGISGGCLEEDVRQVGLEVLRASRPRVLRYDTSDDESRVWGLGLGCNGRVEILVLPVPGDGASGTWARVRELLRGNSAFTLSMRVTEDGDGEVVIGEKLEPAGSGLVFTEALVPPPTLLVVGAGEDARPLVSFAAAAGFRVVLVDHRSARLDAVLFPEAWKMIPLRPEEPSEELVLSREACAVVKTHALGLDTEWVRRLAASDVSYVGILGPRSRTAKILADLGIEGDERIFGPVGLDLGADGPEQVAVSVVAELLAVRAGREPRHLRLRETAVHATR